VKERQTAAIHPYVLRISQEARALIVLIVGGAGYVGSHAARALRRRGHEAIVYDNFSTGYARLADGFELIESEIADSAKLAAALRRVDAVMHFAAHAYVGESVENPRKYFRNNVEAGLALLNGCLDCGVRKFIFSSSCAVYGVPLKVPIAEDSARAPVNPYGLTKLFFEQALEAYDRAYGLRFVSLRYFNAAGADEASGIGEIHQPETHLIPLALEAAMGARAELEIFGTDYPTPDGTCLRDYVHVSDLAEAHVSALDYLDADASSVAVNLGTGRGISVKEIVDAVEKTTGKSVPRRFGPRRPGDPPALIANPRRAEALLHWKAERSLEQMVSSAWKWMQRQPASVAG
jgi:UDP-glucose 4-epimerase